MLWLGYTVIWLLCHSSNMLLVHVLCTPCSKSYSHWGCKICLISYSGGTKNGDFFVIYQASSKTYSKHLIQLLKIQCAKLVYSILLCLLCDYNFMKFTSECVLILIYFKIIVFYKVYTEIYTIQTNNVKVSSFTL